MTLLRQQRWRIAARRQASKRAGSKREEAKQALFPAALVLLALTGAACAQPVFDPAQAPGLDAAGRALYAGWLLTNTPRAIAIGSNGRVGWASGGSAERVRAGALSLCAEHGGIACRIYAQDLDIVWPGREAASPKPPPPLVDTINYSFAADARFWWHGPAAAAGVIVWSHGKQGSDVDARGEQPPPVLRAFNDAGFDVVRFDRAPGVDVVQRARSWLQDELPLLRQMGYRTVVAGGQSRGGWTSLQMLDTPGLVDAVIALSPAAHGAGGDSNLLAQDDDLRAIVANAAPGRSRVVVAQFAGDPFAADEDGRAALLRRLQPREAAVMLIDRPPGFTGHFGGVGQRFSNEFGSCLLRFVTAAVPPATCPQAEP